MKLFEFYNLFIDNFFEFWVFFKNFVETAIFGGIQKRFRVSLYQKKSFFNAKVYKEKSVKLGFYHRLT